MISRTKALKELLAPITWGASSSLGARQRWVRERRNEVTVVLPFLTAKERALAEKWLEKEKHEGLWE
jgi:hypothetical protein